MTTVNEPNSKETEEEAIQAVLRAAKEEHLEGDLDELARTIDEADEA